jgi:hypothetical protein
MIDRDPPLQEDVCLSKRRADALGPGEGFKELGKQQGGRGRVLVDHDPDDIARWTIRSLETEMLNPVSIVNGDGVPSRADQDASDLQHASEIAAAIAAKIERDGERVIDEGAPKFAHRLPAEMIEPEMDMVTPPVRRH